MLVKWLPALIYLTSSKAGNVSLTWPITAWTLNAAAQLRKIGTFR